VYQNEPVAGKAVTPKNFFEALFDFSFKSYVTPKLVKVLFGIVVVLAGLASLFVVIDGFMLFGPIGGIAFLVILGPLYFFLSVLFWRVGLEVVMAVFAIAENTARIAQAQAPAPLGGWQGQAPAPLGGWQGQAGYAPAPPSGQFTPQAAAPSGPGPLQAPSGPYQGPPSAGG